jgi:hypothetical protein
LIAAAFGALFAAAQAYSAELVPAVHSALVKISCPVHAAQRC